MINYRFKLKLLRELDWKLIGIVLLMFIFGLVVLSSATHANIIGSYRKLYVQSLAFILGIGAILFIIMIDYNAMSKYANLLYLVNIILLTIVMIPGIGAQRGGAYSWISVGPLDFQTSELVKLLFIISYAKIVDDNKNKLKTLKGIGEVFIYAVPFFLFLLAQPDLGTAIVFFFIVAAMFFVAGINLVALKKVAVVFLLMLPIIYLGLQPHQKQRIQAFLNPEDVTLQGNYQVMQSLIAVGSGGITGKGLYKGSQNQENFLPVQESDFIFAVIGEELGAIGMIALVLMYMYFISRLIDIARGSKNMYGAIIVSGVTGMFLYQIIQNIAMTIGLMPVTGLTLPFISYGGSSLLTSMASLGLVLNVCMRRKKINF